MRPKSQQRRSRRGRDRPGAAESRTESPATRRVGTAWPDVALLAGIVLFAFALRLIYILQMRESPLFDDPVMDEQYHDQWARAIVAGETYIEGPYFRAPLYAAFLATIYKLFGPGYLVPRLIQAGLGSLSCGVLFLIGRRVFGRAIGSVWLPGIQGLWRFPGGPSVRSGAGTGRG